METGFQSWNLFSAKKSRFSVCHGVEVILGNLKKAKLDEIRIAQIKSILEQADLVCFAGSCVGSDKMRADLSQAQGLIAYFEKHLELKGQN